VPLCPEIPRAPARLPCVFAALAGIFLGVSLLKFGNPSILEESARLIRPGLEAAAGHPGAGPTLFGGPAQGPADIYELIFQAWPIRWGHYMLGLVALAGLAAVKWRILKPLGLSVLPLVWMIWMLISAQGSIDPPLTRITQAHLVTVVLCYCLGALALSSAHSMKAFWGGLLAGFVLMVLVGFEQRFGGLEATRQYVYSQPGWQDLPAEYLKRLASDRIFATMLYPNALAGALLLLVPAMTLASWELSAPLTRPTRLVLASLVLAGGLACLYWSGSKAGWLFALVQAVVLLSRLPIQKEWKLYVIGGLVAAGLLVFCVRFSAYFGKGAPSVSARAHYWRAATRVFLAHPWTGTGPGTFKTNYQRIKPPEAEMAWLAHNDYLQQACDSGWPAAVAYAGFIWGAILKFRPRCMQEPMCFAVWLGLLGWSMQGLTEFGLYVPALGWTAFFLFGWLVGRHDQTLVSQQYRQRTGTG